MTGSFADHVALLSHVLDRRTDIVDAIENRVLNVQAKRTSRGMTRRDVERMLHACVFEASGLTTDASRLEGQLAAAHIADGFVPVPLDGSSHELDPAELTARAYEHWDDHRWPGRNGRVAYARTLYFIFVLRRLEHLSLRVWDDGRDAAENRIREVQRLLDKLNDATSPDAFVRDARWLIQTAQGPLTRHLQPYFRVAERISESFADEYRLGIHSAGARLAGGHLRSQLRFRSGETGLPVDHPDVLSVTRNSNSMDAALLVRDLVALLEAYRAACLGADIEHRLDLADAVLQGVSADPELFLTRLDLLTPCTMIEGVFVAEGDGRPQYSPMGRAHLRHLERYGQLIGELAGKLIEDASRCDPSRNAYSPFGIAYGFCGDILSNMALETLVSRPSLGLALEDFFVSRGNHEDRRNRAEGWKGLPKPSGERRHFEHSIEWAGQVFERTMLALEARACHVAEPNASNLRAGRLFVVPESRTLESLPEGFLPGGIVRAQEHCITSDVTHAFSTEATAFPRSQMLTDRNEGRYLASAESAGKWFAVTKVVLTACLNQGKDALVTGVPQPVVEILRLTCPAAVIPD